MVVTSILLCKKCPWKCSKIDKSEKFWLHSHQILHIIIIRRRISSLICTEFMHRIWPWSNSSKSMSIYKSPGEVLTRSVNSLSSYQKCDGPTDSKTIAPGLCIAGANKKCRLFTIIYSNRPIDHFSRHIWSNFFKFIYMYIYKYILSPENAEWWTVSDRELYLMYSATTRNGQFIYRPC
jgi:hypothetical protein